MFGVVDPTGILQYGQVFIQYTKNIYEADSKNCSIKLLTGKVMITKNPCTVAGDLRLFTAADVPALNYLVF